MILCLCSCAPKEQLVKREPLEDLQPHRQIVQEPGSLYTEANSLFADHRAHQVGDIVTVTISETASASKNATTSSGRNSNFTAGVPTFFGLEASPYLSKQHVPIDASNLINANFNNSFSGNGSTTRRESLTASLTTQVVGIYPNGQLKIRGGKEVMVNSEIQVIYLTGIIRPVDIGADNTIPSDKILNARISYTGHGALSDNQQPGWATRILDYLWPF